MAGFKITGIDQLKKKLDDMKKPEFIQKRVLDQICEKVPEARSERHKMRFIKNGANYDLDPTSISEELYAKIVKSFS
jgi:hypothetical protein